MLIAVALLATTATILVIVGMVVRRRRKLRNIDIPHAQFAAPLEEFERDRLLLEESDLVLRLLTNCVDAAAYRREMERLAVSATNWPRPAEAVVGNRPPNANRS